MKINFDPIIGCPTYGEDNKKIATSGRKTSLKIWLYIILVFSIVGIPIAIGLYIKFLKNYFPQKKQRETALKEFANLNGFELKSLPQQMIKAEDYSYDYDFPYLTSHVINHQSIYGKILEYDFDYSIGSVFVKYKTQISQRPLTYFRIKLNVELPKVYINSKSNNLFGLETDLTSFKKINERKLEGDFINYYDVHIEKDKEIDMYQVLTPEVMDMLKRNHNYDVWLNGNQLVFITHGEFARYFGGLPDIFNCVSLFMKEVDVIAREIRRSKAKPPNLL